MNIRPACLRPGMIIQSWDRPDVLVINAPEPKEDRFGITRLRAWCKRTDTDQEGWMIYGYNAWITVID